MPEQASKSGGCTRSRAEGDNRSEEKRCGSIRADPTARRPEATPINASCCRTEACNMRGWRLAGQPNSSRKPIVRADLLAGTRDASAQFGRGAMRG